MRITIELDDNEINGMLKKRNQSVYVSQNAYDPNWDDNYNPCVNCPNRPGGPNNKSGICNCALPSMYGPFRVTC